MNILILFFLLFSSECVFSIDFEPFSHEHSDLNQSVSALPEAPFGYLAQRTVTSSARKKSVRRRRSMMAYIELGDALNLIKKGNYLEGTKKLFISSQNPKLKNRKMEIRFILGKTFLELGLLHAASFQFISVIDIGNSKYVRRSLEHLSQIATRLGDDKLLQFAIRRDGARKVKGEHRNSLYY